MSRTQITLTSLTGAYVNEVDDVIINGNNINLSGSLILTGTLLSSGQAAFFGNDSGINSTTDKGADVFFYVSGTSGSAGGNVPGVAVFGGDVRVSGSLLVGAGTTIIDENGIRTSNVSGPRITFENNRITFKDVDHLGGKTLNQIVDNGITQLTSDVIAGPGNGSQSATVVALRGNSIRSTSPTSGQVLTFDGSEWAPATPSGGGAVFAGALTVYVDSTNGTDAPGGGTLSAPYRTINYAYSQVPSLGDVNNSAYNANVGKYVTEKLIFCMAPGRYIENVVLGFKRARVQLIGNGVQIIGSLQLLVNRADFPASNMESIKSSFPSPWTGVSAQNTFEITGLAGGGVESDASAVPLIVTGVSSLVFNDATVPGTIASGLAWENNYGTFYFYANKANLISGMVISTAYVSTPTRAFPTCVIEIDSCTIGEGSSPIRTYLGAVPYAYVTGTGWFTGTGVATGTQTATTLQDTTKTWTINQWAGSTVALTSGTGVSQTRTVLSNTSNTLTISGGNWATNPVAGSTVYSLIGTSNQVGEGTLTLKAHNSTIGAAIGARLTIGEIDGCRLYDIDRTLLGTVSNGSVVGSLSSSYLGMVVNQFRQYSGSGIAPSQYQIGSTSTTRFKIDSTSYTTLFFNRSSSTGALTARTLNLSSASGTAASGGASTLTVSGTPWTANQYSNSTVTLTGGTGSGQTRTISSNTTSALTVSVAWTVVPDATTTYTITTTQFDFHDEARSLAYTPVTSANWTAPAPATVQAALDRIAAAVFALRSNSAIP